jgi:hypothetical protein
VSPPESASPKAEEDKPGVAYEDNATSGFSTQSNESNAPALEAASAEPSLEDVTKRVLGKALPTAEPQSSETGEEDLQPPPPSVVDTNDYDPLQIRSAPRVSVEQNITNWREQEETALTAPDWEPEDDMVVEASAKPRTPIQSLEPEALPEPPKVLRREREKKPKKEGPNVVQRVLSKARAKVVPTLQKSALWLAHNLKRRELRKRYDKAVIFAHNRVIDRRLERLFFVPTLKDVKTHTDHGILYDGPIPSRVFDWVLASLPSDLREYAFIDFRAGRGRTVLLASQNNFDRIIGFEFESEFFDDLQMNVAQYPRSFMKCRNIDCYRGDLEGVRIPNQPSILWFSGAWKDEMISGILDYVRQTYQQSPRTLYIVFENVRDEELLPFDPLFEPVEPALSERVKLKLLSPMEFQIYGATS